MTPGFWYLATPYSKYPGGLDAAFQLAVETRGMLIKAGVACFSPIIHSHPVAIACGMDPYDHGIWLPSEAPILNAATGLIIVMADSWETSHGIAVEMNLFVGRPVVLMSPGTIPEELL